MQSRMDWRIFALAEEAYVGEPMANPLIQQSLEDALIEGVKNSGISKRLIRVRHATLEAALNIAVRKQQDATRPVSTFYIMFQLKTMIAQRTRCLIY